MPLFITQGRYTTSAMKGMAAKLDDRKPMVSALIEAAGGKLLEYYITFGEYDFLVISEAPDEHSMAKVVVAAGASGGVTDLKTTLALTTADFAEDAVAAGSLLASFRPAGAG